MKKSNDSNDEMQWHSEFDVFMNSEAPFKNDKMNRQIIESVQSDLQPSIFKVITKLLGVQLIAGAVTLVFCPQFGIGPLGGETGLISFIESFGPLVCGAFCGAFFLMFTAMISAWFFPKAQRKKIAQNPILAFASLTIISYFTLTLISLMISTATNSQSHLNHSLPDPNGLPFILMWIISGIFSSWTLFKMVYSFKKS